MSWSRFGTETRLNVGCPFYENRRVNWQICDLMICIESDLKCEKNMTRYLSLLLSAFLLIGVHPIYANEKVKFTVLGEEFMLQLPAGFCLATHPGWIEIRAQETAPISEHAVLIDTFYQCDLDFKNISYTGDVPSHGWIMHFPRSGNCDQICLNNAILKMFNVDESMLNILNSHDDLAHIREAGVNFKEAKIIHVSKKIISWITNKRAQHPVSGEREYLIANNAVSRNKSMIYTYMEFRTDKFSTAQFYQKTEELIKLTGKLIAK